MAKDEGFKLLRIETVVLRVDIHCDGCRKKVKKLLHKVEGVYTVCVDADQHKVTVSGNVDPDNLIKKLARSGKHAAVWSCQKRTNQDNQQQKQHISHKDTSTKCQERQKELLKTIQNLGNENDVTPWINENGDFDDLNLIANRIKQLNLHGNQTTGNGKINVNVGCGGRNGNKSTEGKRCPEQIPGGFNQQPQQKPNGNYQVFHDGLNQQEISPLLMNMQMMMNSSNINENHNNMMMYQRPPHAPPSTGYQQSYPFNVPYHHSNPTFYTGDGYGDHLFSDESTHACSVM